MNRDLPWKAAIQCVLEGSDDPMHYAEIAEQVAVQGLKKKVGTNPAGSVSAILAMSLQEDDTPFQRVGPGLYTLRSQLRGTSSLGKTPDAENAEVAQSGGLRAFGMYWRRDQVMWRSRTKLFGRQSFAATKVDFADQVGVYLLHDRERVIYVGRASDTLAARLTAHTLDRLSGRWDRFSWFGLRNVGPDGKLIRRTLPWDEKVVIETLEALLIESLEPPLNRRRGDNLSGVEYIQSVDPDLERAEQRRVIDQLTLAIATGETTE